MVERLTWGRRLSAGFIYLLLSLLVVICIFPMLNVLAMSFSSSAAVAAGKVTLLPVQFSLKSYQFVLTKLEFLISVFVSFKRVLIGVPVNMILTVLLAYPLSKEVKSFRWRTVYVWICVVTMLFSGGLIPIYMMVKYTGVMDSIWALVLPSAVPVFNVILLLNFFRALPKELEEASRVDGASHWRVLWSIYIPLSAPALATITLFAFVHHWNSWFDGIIFMNSPAHYPLQSYLRTVVIQNDLALQMLTDPETMAEISDRTSKMAQILLGALPILVVFPFLQRFFVKGIVLGSVKG